MAIKATRRSALIFKLPELCVGSVRSARLRRNAPAPHDSASLEPIAHLGRVIVFAPHPDDETLGCGGLIARLVLNHQPIHVIVISDGSASHPRSRKYPPAKLASLRERETRAALVRLGLRDPHAMTFLGFQDGEVPGPASPVFPNIVLALARLVKNFAADTVVTPFRNDEHADHRATFHIIDTALDKLLPSRPRLLEYGIWGAPGAADAAHEPQCLAYRHYALDVLPVLRRKESAIRKYRSQTGKLIKDDPSGFVLSPRIIAKFTTRWELFSEASPVRRITSTPFTTTTGIILPYFQRKPGLLNQALRSIVTQQAAGNLLIVVIDDQSPQPVGPELRDLPSFDGDIVVQRQSNAGPGAARNAALELLRNRTDRIAFLDSDDMWLPGHLERAHRALDIGADLYFADFRRHNWAETALQRSGMIGRFTARVPGHPDLIEHTGDPIETFLRYHIGTGTIVYNQKRFAANRFPTDYRHAHEDTLYWLKLAQNAQRIIFSDSCVMECCEGVNVYASSTWGSCAELCRLRDEVAFGRRVLREYPLSIDAGTLIRQQMHSSRRSALHALLHQTTHRMEDYGCLRRYLSEDPLILLRVPSTVMSVLWKKFAWHQYKQMR